jgi:pimeloyl-ACP methyl ester carboxylesterase
MLELDVSIQAADAVLSGTLCLPSNEDSFPAVLMLPGSGPLDRNENVEGQRLNIFNTIAHRLVEMGYASLRYDKRGCGLSTGDYFQAGYFDFVEDAIACFDFLRRNPGCLSDRIYALGHSEGALTAMHLSLKRPEMAGIIQLCPSVENIESALLRQASHVRDVMGFTGSDTADPVAAQKNAIERVKNNLAQPEEVERHFIGLKWLREMLGLDLKEAYAKMDAPMLLIAGAKDVQCDPTEIPSIRIASLISQWLVQDDLRRSQ